MYSALILIVIVQLQMMDTLGHDMEPRCSKFHYEEQLLEKMIRMEHSFDLMMEEFRALKAQVSSDLESIKKEKEIMNSALQEEQDRIRSTMMANIAETRQVLEELKSKTDPSSYAFSAYWLSSYDLETLNAVLRFSRTLFDEEDVYDRSTGKYTVPVSGLYTFTSQLCLGGGNYAAVNFVADGIRIGAFDSGDHNNNTCSSGTAVAKLEKGRQVWLQVTDTALYCINNDGSGGFNNFAGYLIRKTQK